MIGQIQALPVTAEKLEAATRQDPILSQLNHFVREDGPLTQPKSTDPSDSASKSSLRKAK